MPRLERDITIVNKLGLHARAATKMAILASEFKASVTLIQGDKQAPASSVLGLLMLESGMGKTMRIVAEGEDAEQAMDALCNLVKARFDEDC
ncbi:HPr family phosphocarrier protein [Shewanella cyperi]|uniref:HPr family phosphocarrier protein n=2 Tax=Shewanella TaxID=22 RepID=A0A974XJI3_9GAMM|nr:MULTISPECIES: HPr family phosphocarrier protein [Shewanella]QSX29545.1 HPr family phosphocarrier protein [Shewanella cyperi]QSX36714.1 HPr family phosphocarrier protein [Shewanella sedimentimangrovi]